MEFAAEREIKKFCIKRREETSPCPSTESMVCSTSLSVSVAVCQQYSGGGQILFSKSGEHFIILLLVCCTNPRSEEIGHGT